MTTLKMTQDPKEELSQRRPNYHNHSYHNYRSYHGGVQGYGYGGYGAPGYGYGYGYGGDLTAVGKHSHRTIRDYLFILRERIWLFLVVFLIVFLGAILYTFNTTPLYTAGTTVQVLRDPVNPLGTEDISKEEIRSAEDLNTQIKILGSLAIINAVAERIKGSERKLLIEPYGGEEAITVNEVLYDNREVTPLRASLLVAVQYTHPDPRVASYVANLFADEFIGFC